MRVLKGIFNYLAPIWSGADGKPSLRAILAIALTIDFIRNLSWAITKWDQGRTFEGLAMVLGIEAGMITALLALTTYQNTQTGITRTIETGEPPIKTTTEAKGAAAVDQVES